MSVLRAGMVAQLVKGLVTKLNDLSLINPWWKEGTNSHKLFFELHTCSAVAAVEWQWGSESLDAQFLVIAQQALLLETLSPQPAHRLLPPSLSRKSFLGSHEFVDFFKEDPPVKVS